MDEKWAAVGHDLRVGGVLILEDECGVVNGPACPDRQERADYKVNVGPVNVKFGKFFLTAPF